MFFIVIKMSSKYEQSLGRKMFLTSFFTGFFYRKRRSRGRKFNLLLFRTIRTIYWTAEEPGYFGSFAYYITHRNWTNETFYFVSESDGGAFRPKTEDSLLSFSGTKNQVYGKSFLVQNFNLASKNF